MDHHFIIACAPLPPATPEELLWWRAAFDAALAPLLDARQLAHVRRFGQGERPVDSAGALRAGLSRLLARALLVVHAADAMAVPEPEHAAMQKPGRFPDWQTLSGPLRMDALGRPLLHGWQAAFCHSGLAAFCALRPAHQPAPTLDPPLPPQAFPKLAVDAEALSALPPAGRAFAPDEVGAPLRPPFAARESLRRWTVKEALLKSCGVGLGMDPALVPSGGFGRRAGLWRGPRGPVRWRIIPCPGHWLCMALPNDKSDDASPLLVWRRPQDLPRLLERLRRLRQRM